MRYSRQRELILNTLRSSCLHPTAEEIYASVCKTDPNISLGTVYRNLNQLAEIGEILRIPSPFGKDRFDGCGKVHYHLRCEKCGRLVDLPVSLGSDFESLLAKVAEVSGLTVFPGNIVVDGVCGQCEVQNG